MHPSRIRCADQSPRRWLRDRPPGRKAIRHRPAQLRWIATDDLEVSLAGDFLEDKSGIAPGVATYADRTAIEANPANPTITLTTAQGNTILYHDHIFVPYGPYHNASDPINDPYVTYATVADYGPMYMLPGDPALTQPVPWKPRSSRPGTKSPSGARRCASTGTSPIPCPSTPSPRTASTTPVPPGTKMPRPSR